MRDVTLLYLKSCSSEYIIKHHYLTKRKTTQWLDSFVHQPVELFSKLGENCDETGKKYVKRLIQHTSLNLFQNVITNIQRLESLQQTG